MKFASLALTLSVGLVACGGAFTSDEEAEVDSTAQPLSGVLAYRGVNLCGAEFGVDAYGNGALPGTFGTNYTYPDATYVSGYASPDYFIGKGATTFRLPFRWERLQPTRNAPFNTTELGRLRTTVNNLLAKGTAVILDPQNFARYGTATIGSASVPNGDFRDFWTRLATEFKGKPNVLFNLVNEPHDIGTEQWVSAANAAIAGIRSTGATNLILVPGNGWTGAHSWSSSYYGTSNATAMLNIVDPGNNYAFEVHQYLDADSGGGGSECVSPTIGSERLDNFTRWLRAHGKRGFVGELGGPATSTCVAAIDDMLKHVEANADVYLGWTYWAGGPWWNNYALSVEPSGGTDRPQMKALLPHLRWTSPTTTTTTTPTTSTTTPTTTACTPGTYEAESMTATTGGATSGGWNLWSNGSLTTTRDFVAGRTTLTVYAAGQSAGGVWPHMAVSVGGVAVGSANVTSTSYGAYSFSFDATAGTKEVRVTFDNDGIVGSEDRNLLVDRIVVGCPAAPAPACTAQSFEAESITHSTGGATTGGWNLWSNGYVATNASFTTTRTTVVVGAAGSYASGWPHFVVTVDGVAIGSATASTTTYRDYAFTFTPSSSGTKQIRVTFDNDYASGKADRNLLLDKVGVRCP